MISTVAIIPFNIKADKNVLVDAVVDWLLFVVEFEDLVAKSEVRGMREASIRDRECQKNRGGGPPLWGLACQP
jgi:hypothetical protein